MIVFDESEYAHAAVSDEVYDLVALFLGPECAKKLLISGDLDVSPNRLDPARDRPAPEKRIDGNDDSGPFDIWNTPADQEPEAVAPVEEVSALDRVG